MSEEVTVEFFYDVEKDLVMIHSSITSAWHEFIRQSVLDFVEWLKFDRWKDEKWFHLYMMHNYHREIRTLVSCDGGGGYSGFMDFSSDDSEFRKQFTAFSRAIEYFDRDVIRPYNICSQRKSRGDIVLLNLKAFEGRPIWQSGADE